MKSNKYLSYISLTPIIILICFFSYTCEKVQLKGDISGIVTDNYSGESIEGVLVELLSTDDSTRTDSSGNYKLQNITPGSYDIKASKIGYVDKTENLKVPSGKTVFNNMTLEGKPLLKVSTEILDFMIDSIILFFNISNIGMGPLVYNIYPSQDWINIDPEEGILTDQTENLTVTIDRTGLYDNIVYEETIDILYDGPKGVINVFVNRSDIITDSRDGKEYKTIKIGNQWWLAENLNIGVFVEITNKGEIHIDASNNGIIEKYCFLNNEANCDTFGGLYDWDEMMQYNPSDEGEIGTTQGICPDGWHLPTHTEWTTLTDYLGGITVAGGKLKEAGTRFWNTPNNNATNESGFTALPGGHWPLVPIYPIGTHAKAEDAPNAILAGILIVQ